MENSNPFLILFDGETISGKNNKDRLIILLNYIVFELLIIYIKNLLKTDRPCVAEKGCPPYYDIPSGHSFGGIYFYLS